MRPARRAAPVLGLVLLLAACGTPTAPGGPSRAVASDAVASAQGFAGCPTSGTGTDVTTSGHQVADAVPLGADEEVAVVVMCRYSEKLYPGEGSWRVVTELRATRGLDPLVAALRQPSPTDRPAGCTEELRVMAWFALVMADGRVVRPTVPLDSCGHPLPATATALDHLSWQEGPTTRIAESQTQAQVDLEARAAAVGCPYAFKDLLTMMAADLPRLVPAAATPVRVPAGSTLSVCRMSAGTVGADPVLTFVSGEQRRAAATDRLTSALQSSSSPAKTCTESSPRQVVIQSDKGAYVVVELDGCHRVLSEQGRSTLTEASPELLAALG